MNKSAIQNIAIFGALLLTVVFIYIEIKVFPAGNQESRKHAFIVQFKSESKLQNFNPTYGLPGSIDSVEQDENKTVIKGWVAYDNNTRLILVTENSEMGDLPDVEIWSSKREDVAHFLNDLNQVQSGFVFDLPKSEHGILKCVYVNKLNLIRLLYSSIPNQCLQ